MKCTLCVSIRVEVEGAGADSIEDSARKNYEHVFNRPLRLPVLILLRERYDSRRRLRGIPPLPFPLFISERTT
jgi:hypothetical protein